MTSEPIVYVNGTYLPASEAKISIYDRGFLFADGVYEVTSVLYGKLIDNSYHLRRLKRSLSELRIDAPCQNLEELETIQKELITRNNLQEGVIYIQITRGSVVGERDLCFPEDGSSSTLSSSSSSSTTTNHYSTLVMFTQNKSIINNPQARNGIQIITVSDLRWKRCDIKTINLLAQMLAKNEARRAGVDDVWLVDENGCITEGTSSNSFLVKRRHTHKEKEDGNGRELVIVTRHLSNEILHGVTRRAVLTLAEKMRMDIIERPFSVEEALDDEDTVEAFSTSTSTVVLPVISINGTKVGDGKPGRIATRLRELYLEMAPT